MATDPRKLASNDKHLQKLDRITFRLYKDGRDGMIKDDISKAAERDGLSVNAWILEAIRDKL